MQNQAPVYVLNRNAKREQGKHAQVANIKAAKAVSDIVRTTLGPKSMLKMLLDPMGGIVLTNDGNAILREVSLTLHFWKILPAILQKCLQNSRKFSMQPTNITFMQIDVTHPAAKSMIELSRAQDEEVGDGTTSVIILAGEVLAAVEGFLEKDIHPTVIVNSYFKALEDLNTMTENIGVSNQSKMAVGKWNFNITFSIGCNQHGE